MEEMMLNSYVVDALIYRIQFVLSNVQDVFFVNEFIIVFLLHYCRENSYILHYQAGSKADC
jgi:hypothetical protein